MIHPDEVNRTELRKFAENFLRKNKGKPFSLTDLTLSYFGMPEKGNYKEIYLFDRRAKLIVHHALRKIQKIYGVHIFTVKGRLTVLENERDFNWVIRLLKKMDDGIKRKIKILEKDKDKESYHSRVKIFYEGMRARA